MNPEEPNHQTQPITATLRCSGTNRFGRPCLNPVLNAGDNCTKCRGEVENPFPVPEKARPSPALPDLEISEWTSADSLNTRLSKYAHGNERLQRLIDVGVKLAGHSKAQGTQIAYSKHWETFEEFRREFGLEAEFPVPPEHVAYFVAFLTDRGSLREAGRALSHGYIRQAIGAIRQRHTTRNLPSPTDDILVEESLEGYAKIFGVGSVGTPALTATDLGKITTHLAVQDTELRRNRAMCILLTHPDLHLTFGQLAQLCGEHIIDDIEPHITLLITKKGGRLDPVELPIDPNPAACPTAALKALEADNYGPIFRNQRGIGLSRQGIHFAVANLIAQPARDATGKSGRRTLDSNERAALTARLSVEPLTQLRTRAVLLNGYWAAFRGSELAALRWSDAKHVKQGIEWRVRRAKNDQRGDGHTTPVPRIADPFMCPVQALLEYRQAVELHLGREPTANDPVFFALNRSPSSPTAHLSVASFTYIVNHAAEAAGLAGGPFTSHSLRSGFVTAATDNGASPEQIQRHGRWASTKSLSPYYRRANLWSDANAATKIANNFLSRNTRGVEGFK